MGHFFNNTGMSVNILAAMNAGNNSRAAISTLWLVKQLFK
jgi:hypothetical protein